MENDTPRRMPNVPPFVKFVCANVPMVFDDSLSYYEALCALWKYVQGMTDVINNNATLEEEYIQKFDELKEFVDTYFDNLDIQEELNKKLDEMAEDGTLASIIGSTLSCYYNVKVDNNYYESTSTHYKVITIPRTDYEGNTINLKLGIANDNYIHPKIGETVRSYSNRHHTTVATNGGYANVDSTSPIYQQPDGVLIRNGVLVLDNTDYMSEQRQRLWYLAVMANGDLRTFEPMSSAASMLEAGAGNVVLGEVPIVVDGENFHETHPDVPSGSGWTTPYPHAVWGQNADGDYLMFICNGKGNPTEQGIALTDIADILINDYNATFAMGVDPGGSAQATYKGYLQNIPSDVYFSKEREVATILYIGKDIETLSDYQENEVAEEKILSDASYESENSNVFRSGFMTLKCLDNDVDFSGIDCYQQGKRTKLFLSPTNLLYNRYDENNQFIDNLFSAAATGFITTNKGRMAHVPAVLPLINTDDDPSEAISYLNYFTARYCPPSTHEKALGDEPYTDSFAIVFNIPTSSASYREQIAFPIGSATNTHYPVRRYAGEENVWSAWSRYGSNYYTDWNELTSTKGTFSWKRQGDVVFIKGSVTSGQSGVLCTLPDSIVPAENVVGAAFASGNNMAKCYVNSNNKQLGLNTPDTAGNYVIDLTYIV